MQVKYTYYNSRHNPSISMVVNDDWVNLTISHIPQQSVTFTGLGNSWDCYLPYKTITAKYIQSLVPYLHTVIVAYQHTQNYKDWLYRVELVCANCWDNVADCYCKDCIDCLTVDDKCNVCNTCWDCCYGYHDDWEPMGDIDNTGVWGSDY